MSTRLDIDGARHALAILGPGPVDTVLLARYRELPVLLRRTGLIATLATVLSRCSRQNTGAAYTAVADALASVIAVALRTEQGRAPAELLVTLTKADPADYITAARRADHMFVWLKRLAEARHLATPPAPAGPGHDHATEVLEADVREAEGQEGEDQAQDGQVQDGQAAAEPGGQNT